MGIQDPAAPREAEARPPPVPAERRRGAAEDHRRRAAAARARGEPSEAAECLRRPAPAGPRQTAREARLRRVAAPAEVVGARRLVEWRAAAEAEAGTAAPLA